MRALAIETATTACAVALADGPRREVRLLDQSRHHTETLAPGIAHLLEDHGLTPGELDRVIVDVGPGLFTGLRVGVASATALAQATGAELVGVTSLACLAEGVRRDGVRGRVLAVVDARRAEVFVQEFALDEESARPQGEPVVSTARAEVITWATLGAPVSFVGDGALRYRDDFAAVPNGAVIEIALPSLEAALDLGMRGEPVGALRPLYLRDADAVANFATRDQRP